MTSEIILPLPQKNIIATLLITKKQDLTKDFNKRRY
jgi:hypothetical protein